MQSTIKLVDTTRFVRDPHSKGLISSDPLGLSAYRARRSESEKVRTLEESINTLQTELAEMRNILSAALSHRNTN